MRASQIWNLQDLSINTIRFLAADAVEKAKSVKASWNSPWALHH